MWVGHVTQAKPPCVAKTRTMEPPPTTPRKAPKPPLPTPSASPPASGSRQRDTPPPFKRRRLQHGLPKPPPSAAKLPQTDDYFKERQASALKLVQVWSSLAERYSKPLDQDDIVDIRTGEVIKDRGVIDSWDTSQQGSFTYEGKQVKQSKPKEEDEGEVGTEEDDESGDGVDELDAFYALGNTPRKEAKMSGVDDTPRAEARAATRAPADVEPGDVPPLYASKAEEDLKEFLEAEERRKEICGDDKSSDEDIEVLQAQLWRFRTSVSPKKRTNGRLKSPQPVVIESDDGSPAPPDKQDDKLDKYSSDPTLPPSSSPVPPSSDEEIEIVCVQQRFFVPPSSSPMPPSSTELYGDGESSDEDIKILRAQLRRFRALASPKKRRQKARLSENCFRTPRKVVESDSEKPRSSKSLAPRFETSSKVVESDNEEELILPRRLNHRLKTSRKVVESDEEEPILSKRVNRCLKTLRKVVKSNDGSPAPSDALDDELDNYSSDARLSLPPSSSPVPPSSPPVPLPLELESEDELGRWDRGP